MSHHHVNQLIHLMWSTKGLQYSFSPSVKSNLLAYITALVRSKKGDVFATGGSADHVHLLLLLPPEISLANLVTHMKAFSSKWLKTKDKIASDFSWQNGYLAISTQRDRMDHVCEYIRSDAIRHHSKSYTEELLAFLKQQNIAFDERYFQTNSFSKVYVHAVWATYNRIPFLEKTIRANLYHQMSNTVSKFRGVVHEIGGIEDHVHLLIELPKDIALSDLVREIKTSATHWIRNQENLKFRNFEWQTGYGAFTISLPNVEIVKKYIQQQEEHHHRQLFQDEWNNFLQKNGFAAN